MLFYTVIPSPLGPLTVVVSERGVRELQFGTRPRMPGTIGSAEKTAAVRRQLEEYFAGRRREFDLDFDLVGSPFQKKVWSALLEIPYGKTRSYGEIARSIGLPQAARAVGRANGQNPVAILVPCHRVIGANGALTGYSARGGIKTKQKLLDLESAGQAF